jgi:cell division septum initiation protein DivIVA
VLNFPLPNREELSALLDKIIEDIKQFKQVKIDLDEGGRERLLQAALGLTLGEAENVFAKSMMAASKTVNRSIRVRSNGSSMTNPSVAVLPAAR